jgi:hypothetical protein
MPLWLIINLINVIFINYIYIYKVMNLSYIKLYGLS